MTGFPVDRYGFIHRYAAIEAGFTDDELKQACRRNEIVRLTRGVFVLRSPRTPEQWHRLGAIAVGVQVGAGKPLSHQSAAVIHGLEMLMPNYRRIHLTTGERSGGRRTTCRHEHVRALGGDDVVAVDGVTITSVERTAVDVACTSPHGFAGALAVLDSALRRGADRAVLVELLRERCVGAPQARRALHFADGAAENPGESWSRAQIIEAGLPLPRLQHRFHDAAGNEIARTDFDWSGLLVGEFDGAAKYVKHLRPGETAADAVSREKAREDALRRTGVMVIRWTWADLKAGQVASMVREWLVRLHLLAA